MNAEIDAIMSITFALLAFGVLVLYRQSDATYLTLTALVPLSLLVARFVDPRNEPAIFGLSAAAGIGWGVLFYISLRILLTRHKARGIDVNRVERVSELEFDHLIDAPKLHPGQQVTFELASDGVLRNGTVREAITGAFTLDDGNVYLVSDVKRLEIALSPGPANA